MLQIPIKHDDSRSCVDDIVVAIADWYGCDYQLMFSESWEFEFTAGSIILPREDKRYDLIGKYHRLKMTFHDAENAEQLIQKIMDELKEGRPIAIYIDTFWCPWYVGKFQEVHSDHFCIVLGYDEEKGAFYCIDGQMSTTPVELPVQMLKEGYDNYIAFRLTEDNEPEWDWQEIIMKAVDSIGLQNKDNNMFSSMTDFASYLNEGFNMSNEIHGYENEPSLAPIFQQLKKVNRGRKQFAIALGYIAEKKGIDELQVISDRLNKAGDIWISIYGMLIKSLYIDNPKQITGRISKKVMEISDIERSIAEDLVKISSGAYAEDTDSSSQESLYSSDFLLSDYCYVNLDKHFNNQGFSKDLTPACKAEFSNIGKYFIDDGLSEKREWAVEYMKFR
ncbi:MAG: hypothetical protein K0R84_2260, partial [Clostridia bacterium]|nr:hypothetical protein [Clostridia bacterium]